MIVTIYNLTTGPILVRNPYTGILNPGSSKAVHNVPAAALAGNLELNDLLQSGSIQLSIAPDAGIDPRVTSPTEQAWMSFSNPTGAALVQYGVVRAVDGSGSSTGIAAGVAPAQADTGLHSTGIIGVVQNAPAAASDVTGLARVALSGQLAFVAFDVTGGHAEPVAGGAAYLSQTRSMYAQADLPGTGAVVVVGTVVSNGIAKTGDSTTGLALVLIGSSVAAGSAAPGVITDATMTGAGTLASPLSVVPQFASDTTIDLPNSASQQVASLRLVTQLTAKTASSEASNLVFTLLSGGVPVTALDIEPGQTLFPSGTQSAPGIAFQASPGSGLDYANGDVNVNVAGITRFIVSPGAGVSTTSNLPYYVGTSNTEGIGFNGTSSFWVFSTAGRDIVLGNTGALLNAAVSGFADLPMMAGPPTGTPTPPTGKMPVTGDSTNHKVWVWFPDGWHYLQAT